MSELAPARTLRIGDGVNVRMENGDDSNERTFTPTGEADIAESKSSPKEAVPLGGLPPAGLRTVPSQISDATRIVLIRHGESKCSNAGIVGGLLGCTGLSQQGVFQAQRLRDRLVSHGELADASVLYASTLPRALETAEIVSPGVGGGHLGIVRESSLCELEPGEADGLTWVEFTERYGDPDWDSDQDRPVAPGGESWRGFVDRASGAVQLLADHHPGETVVVACHAGIVEATMLRFLPVADRPRLGLRTENTSMTQWEIAGGRWRLISYNDCSHLAVSVAAKAVPPLAEFRESI